MSAKLSAGIDRYATDTPRSSLDPDDIRLQNATASPSPFIFQPFKLATPR